MENIKLLNLFLLLLFFFFYLKENGAEHLDSKSLPQSRDYSTLPSPGHTSSTESTVTSSDSGSETLNMASGDLDCKSLCEKKDTRSASTVIKFKDTSPAHENIVLEGSVSEDKIMLNLAEFLRLSLGFKCDWFTLEKRVKLEERSRDLAEENLKTEITNCLKLLESLTPLCEDDNQAQEIIKKLEKSITFLSQCTARVASRAEMLGAINQESRVSKAVEVMIQHVENLKRMYAKEHAELEELKQVLLQNERSFNPLEDEDDCQIKKRSSSLNSKTSVRKANKALWFSVALIVLFAALMSFLTGRFFQKSVDAAPTQDGDSWMSLEHILWPFTRLQHNGPPPV
ncbi:Lymphoid-restricted membrane protein [Pteropus alecto]|uniref:Lymphoid-restricted membrane protein n=1 Tax=Pteropus alecto TaxID=9402 RepID=L5KN49_PTEAL|nr:Lymphoid-restricted membrane protein [Pteropus alecto]